MKFARLAIALSFLASSLSSIPTLAATSSASFAVSVTVQSACQASAPAVAFGNRPIAGSSPVSVSCTLPTAYDVSLSATLSGGATEQAASPIKTMQIYKLLADAAHTYKRDRIAGTETLARAGTESSNSATLYRQTALTQGVAYGAFADAVTVTVTY